jgi:hypothetical protein
LAKIAVLEVLEQIQEVLRCEIQLENCLGCDTELTVKTIFRILLILREA